MAKIEFKSTDKYIAQMKALERHSTDILKKAVYNGAGAAANGIRGAIESTPSGERRPGPGGIADYEKEAMLQGLGTSTIKEESGYVNGKVGFGGYINHKGRKIPIPMIVRSVEKGTSFMTKVPIVSKAIRRDKVKIIALMDRTIYEEINKILK